MRRAWEWVKAHSLWLFAGVVGLIAAYYLILRPGSGKPTSTQISFPPQMGGGLGGGGPTGPYSPETTTATSITTNSLSSLQTRLASLQQQLSDRLAVLQAAQPNAYVDDDPLVIALRSAIDAVSAEIAGLVGGVQTGMAGGGGGGAGGGGTGGGGGGPGTIGWTGDGGSGGGSAPPPPFNQPPGGEIAPPNARAVRA